MACLHFNIFDLFSQIDTPLLLLLYRYPEEENFFDVALTGPRLGMKHTARPNPELSARLSIEAGVSSSFGALICTQKKDLIESKKMICLNDFL